MAQLIADAQGHYLWHDDKNTGSLPLSFEQVYAKAKDADVWINLSGVKTKKELLGFESRYSAFKAFKTGQMYNNNKFTNALGYSTYWETGMIHPDRILSDIIQLLHPELKSQIKNDLYYYQQIN
jgi:iron complex transport system substrate-binding protein